MNSVGSNRPSPAPSNYVRISRELQDHPVVGFGQPVKPADPSRGAYSRAEAWLFLVFQARWRTSDVNNRGRVITLERGELLGARSWLASVWNWTEKQVRGFLDRLEAEMMIDRKMGQSQGQSEGHKNSQKSAHFVNVLSIRNYSIYQTAIEDFCAQKGHSGTDGRAMDRSDKRANQGPHINKGNNNTITTLENNNRVLAPLSSSAQDDDFSWSDDGIVQVRNGSRGSLEKLLDGAATLDEVLIEISPRLPDKPVGRQLVIAVSSAVSKHVQELDKFRQKRGTRLPRDWRLPKSWSEWAMQDSRQASEWVRIEAEKFRDYWIAQPGTKGTKLDWEATWRNWVRSARKAAPSSGGVQSNFNFSGKYIGRGI